jgi:hypothetical protein
MTYKEALAVCKKDEWLRLVLMSEEHLGKNAFLTESSYLKKDDGSSPISGVVDKSKGKRLIMTIYLGGNEFTTSEVPFAINPDSEGWEPKVFIGDLSIGEFELNGVKLRESEDGSIEILEQDKLKKLMQEAQDVNFSIKDAVEKSEKLSESIDILNPYAYFKK